jgi:hypothetical protein
MNGTVGVEDLERFLAEHPEAAHPIDTKSSGHPDELSREWDAPISLEEARLPEFPKGIFPPWLDEMVNAVSQSTETPLELAALTALGVVAACVQRKTIVEVRSDYSEPLNLWTCPALDSGNRKTAVLGAMTAPLRAFERERNDALAPDILRIESERNTAQARIDELRRQAARAGSEDFGTLKNEIVRLESELPELPKLPRIWAQDITPEKLGVAMADAGERMALISDEGGIFEILAGRYNGGVPNLDLFLQAHSGAAYRVDRGNRPPVLMEHPALTLVLSPQPEVLKGLASKPGFRGRGLLARFCFALPISRLGYRSGDGPPVGEGVASVYAAGIHRMLEWPESDSPVRLRLTAEALDEWAAFSQVVETHLRDGSRFEQIRDWAGKLPGTTARIAGGLHCSDHAFATVLKREISGDAMQRALVLAAVLSEHALAVFDLMGENAALNGARKIWRCVTRKRWRTFSFRDAFQALRGSFTRAAELDAPFEVLIERSYIALRPTESRAGRPSRIYDVNPALTGQWPNTEEAR